MHLLVILTPTLEIERVSLCTDVATLDVFEGSCVDVSSHAPATVITPDIY